MRPGSSGRRARSALPLSLVFLVVSVGCSGAGDKPPGDADYVFQGTAAVRVTPAKTGEWLVLFEKLQTQLLVTSPIRSAGLLREDSGIGQRYEAPDGWILLDAAAHSSGDVSLLIIKVDDTQAYPLRVMVSRFMRGGGTAQYELQRLVPVGEPEAPPVFMASLDRARIVVRGDDVFALVRWANNSVQAYRLAFDGAALAQRWATWVEPAASLFSVGIIGGGFDNFHQGDSEFFVYLDVDADGSLVACVPSTQEVLPAHDAFFGENLMAEADPANFDFGTAIVTRIAPDGSRRFATLAGIPGRQKRLLNLRIARDTVLLVGRQKTGDQPDSWDGWILSSDLSTGEPRYEKTIHVQAGDVFLDAAPLTDGRIVAVGSTNYTQNPTGLSVSDARDPLALMLDSAGGVLRRIELPAGPRGNEGISVTVASDGRIAISGVQNAPGTHAEVFSDAFVAVRPAESL
jgi:hypothetical protein